MELYGRRRTRRPSRIRDEAISNINVKPEVLLPHRSHRSLSRMGRTGSPDIRDIRRSENKKQIPMTNEKPLIDPPFIKRWNSIQNLSRDNIQDDQNSISPLTVIKDQYDTKRPVSNYITSNSGYYLAGTPAEQQQSKNIPNNSHKQATGSISTQFGNKLYSKMNEFIGNKSLSLIKYQSELDSDDEIKTSELNNGDNLQVEMGEMSNLEKLDLNIEEINEFQNHFIKKFNNPQDPTSRVQKKVLDYKDLQEEPPKSYLNLILSDYSSRIQHETLMHQYNLIRHRFASAPRFGEYLLHGHRINEPTTQYLKSNMGILGFINRNKLSGRELDSSINVKFQFTENVDEYLKTMWTEESDALGINSTNSSTPETPQTPFTPFTPITPFASSPLAPGHMPDYTNPKYSNNLSTNSSFDLTNA